MLRSLLLSPHEKTLRVIARVFKDLEVELEHCIESDAAIAHATRHRYDAIVIDDDVEQAHLVLEKIVELPSCNKSVRIVLADPAGTMHAIFKNGTQVILYKPLSPERVRQGLRAVRNLMARDRRRGAARVRTALHARMSPRLARNERKSVLVADLSDSGAAIHCDLADLPASGEVNLEFWLPGELDLIRVTCELVWRDNEGRAGVRFLDMPAYARKNLVQWLKDNPAPKATRPVARAAKSGH